jgi:hypothetical protein
MMRRGVVQKNAAIIFGQRPGDILYRTVRKREGKHAPFRTAQRHAATSNHRLIDIYLAAMNSAPFANSALYEHEILAAEILHNYETISADCHGGTLSLVVLI